VIWATNLEEVVGTSSENSGGKAMGGGSKVRTTTTTYSYFANLAVGLCEGPISAVLRVWADGKPLDLSTLTYRIYTGDEAQTADPLIVAKEGDAPAYRGLAYVVFERLPLEDFGNRIPQLSFEVVRAIGRLEQMVRAVTLIPGATEFGYEPDTVVRVMGPGQSAPEIVTSATRPPTLLPRSTSCRASRPISSASRSSWPGLAPTCARDIAVCCRHRQCRQDDEWSDLGGRRHIARYGLSGFRRSAATRPMAARRPITAWST